MDHRSPDHDQSALLDHPITLPPMASQQGVLAWQARPDRHGSLGGDPRITCSCRSTRWWVIATCRSGSRERGAGVYPDPPPALALECALRLPEHGWRDRRAGGSAYANHGGPLGQAVRERDRAPLGRRSIFQNRVGFVAFFVVCPLEVEFVTVTTPAFARRTPAGVEVARAGPCRAFSVREVVVDAPVFHPQLDGRPFFDVGQPRLCATVVSLFEGRTVVSSFAEMHFVFGRGCRPTVQRSPSPLAGKSS